VRHAAIIAIAALLLLAACGSGDRAVHRKACAKIFTHPKTGQVTVKRYACSDYHPVRP
jgi:hypothetical protein